MSTAEQSISLRRVAQTFSAAAELKTNGVPHFISRFVRMSGRGRNRIATRVEDNTRRQLRRTLVLQTLHFYRPGSSRASGVAHSFANGANEMGHPLYCLRHPPTALH